MPHITTELLQHGYSEPRYVSELQREAQDADAEQCAAMTCAACGAVGMTHVPMVLVQYGVWTSYVAVARCGRCGYEVEF
jgi:ribosomal protein L37AE/L43A